MATRTVTAPDPNFGGARAGVVFREGRGEVDADDAPALAYFERHGYPVDTPSPSRRGRSTAKAAEAEAAEPAEPDPADEPA
jgi:hypothetical protein